MHDTPKTKLDRYGWYIVVGTFAWPFIQLGILLAIIQRLDLVQIWLNFVVNLIVLPTGILIVAIVNPELVNHRGRWRQKKDTKKWDQVLIRLFMLNGVYLTGIVAALDIGRYQWSVLPPAAWYCGVVMCAAGNAILYWAMLINRHFETTVRLQTDRGQTVVTTGPYRYIRHPGYAGAMLWVISGSLMLGSAVSLIPAVIGCLVLVLRTRLEDGVLKKELQGYAEYAGQVPYRLIPGIW